MPEYRVICVPKAERQIRELKAKSRSSTERQDLIAMLAEVNRKLNTQPLDWGDPERRTKKPGGIYCHGIHSKLIVQYAVLELERRTVRGSARSASRSLREQRRP